jgi:arylsulfatase A-like enzyme
MTNSFPKKLFSATVAVAMTLTSTTFLSPARAQQAAPAAPAATEPAATQDTSKPNILVIFGDDIGQTNISAYSFGLVGYRTPNIDRIAKEGMMFTDYYAENSCTAGRSTFITGQVCLRTGLCKVGIPGATVGLQARDITIAQALKPLGYATGQFGKNHLGDRDEYLPTKHGFDELLPVPDVGTSRSPTAKTSTPTIAIQKFGRLAPISESSVAIRSKTLLGRHAARAPVTIAITRAEVME